MAELQQEENVDQARILGEKLERQVGEVSPGQRRGSLCQHLLRYGCPRDLDGRNRGMARLSHWDSYLHPF